MATSYQGNMEKAAIASGRNLPVSWKVAYEIGNAVRGKSIEKVIAFLERVIAGTEAVPYKRFNSDVGHKPGKIAAGRYPIKAAEYVLNLVKSARSNAEDKGLDLEILQLVHFSSGRGSSQWRYGRQRRRKMKSTHIDVVVAENPSLAKKEVKKDKKVVTKDAKKEVKAEAKVETKTVETKAKVSENKVKTKKAETVKAEDKAEVAEK